MTSRVGCDPTTPTSIVYDAKGRVSSIARPDGLETCTYDDAGRLIAVTAPFVDVRQLDAALAN